MLSEINEIERQIANLRISRESVEREDISHSYCRKNVQQEAYRDQIFEAIFERQRPEKESSIFSGKSLDRKEALQKQLKKIRPIPQTSFRKLETGGILFDFYSHPLHISSRDTVAIAIDRMLYTQSPGGRPEKLPIDHVTATCVHWLKGGDTLLSGFTDGIFCFNDAVTLNTYRSVDSKKGRIICASSPTPFLVYIGFDNGQIAKVDLRQPTYPPVVGSHKERPCGLAISPDGVKLASGSNDNKIKIWDLRHPGTALAVYGCHAAAIKALAWAPWQRDLLFSGGGANDKTIKAISVKTDEVIAEKKTDSQITDIHVCSHKQELVSCHALDENCSVVWKYEDKGFYPMATLQDSKTSIHHSAMSADGTTLVTSERDECLHFWKVFEEKPKVKKPPAPFSSDMHSTIR